MTSRLLPVLVVTVLAGFARGQDFPAPGNLAPPAGGEALPGNLAPPASEPRSPARDYAACVAAVDEGKTVVLCVGVFTLDVADFYAAELRDDKGTPFAPGRYLCWLENGVRRMQLKDPPASRPAPPAR